MKSRAPGGTKRQDRLAELPRDKGTEGRATRDEHHAPHHPAFKSPAAIVLILTIAAAGLAADLLSKHYVFKSVLDRPDMPQRVARFVTTFEREYGRTPMPGEVLHHFQRQVMPGMRFTLSTNPGVVFGLPMPRWLVAIAHAGAGILVLILFATSDRGAHMIHVALALTLAGALGNFYDRMFSQVVVPGYQAIRNQVRDFIDCSQLHYKYIFNVADVFLVLGVVILILHWILGARRDRAAQPGETSKPDTA